MKRKVLKVFNYVVIIALLVTSLLPVYSVKAVATWWNTDWNYRNRISFNASTITGNLTHFPLTLYLDTSNLDFSKVAANGTDLRFVDSDDLTELYYERVIWSDTAGSENATVIVHVPQINALSNYSDYIYMYYGNTDASDSHDPENTWASTGAVAVYHFYSLTNNGTVVYDSTSNNNDLTNNGTSWTSSGRLFDGSNNLYAGSDYISANACSIISWLYPTTLETITGNYIVDNGKTTMVYLSSAVRLYSDGSTAAFGGSLSTDTWQNVGAVRDLTGDADIYINAVNQTVAGNSGTPAAGTTNVLVGLRASGIRGFKGTIADILITDEKQTTEWLEYYYDASQEKWTGTDGGAVLFGSEVTSPRETGYSLARTMIPMAISIVIIIAAILANNPNILLGGVIIGIIAFYAVQAMLNI